MNISSHCVFPNRWEDGQWTFGAVSGSSSGHCMTHWFPIDTTNLTIFMSPSNAISLFGLLVSSASPNEPARPLSSITLPFNGTVQDRYTPSASSKPFTYILF